MKNSKCPYCGGKVLYSKDSTHIYKKNYGGVYYCENYPKCDAYVGVHRRTVKPLGRLANKELRQAKQLAHYYFDFLWKYKKENDKCKNARDLAYNWLSQQLDIPLKYTHIGMFDLEECQSVVNLCKPYVYRLKDKENDKRWIL